MTTEPQTTSPTAPANPREVYSQLAASDLPAPKSVTIVPENPVVTLSFASEADLETWADALNATRCIRRELTEDGRGYSWYYTFSGWMGRHGYMTYHEPLGASS